MPCRSATISSKVSGDLRNVQKWLASACVLATTAPGNVVEESLWELLKVFGTFRSHTFTLHCGHPALVSASILEGSGRFQCLMQGSPFVPTSATSPVLVVLQVQPSRGMGRFARSHI